MVDWYVIRAVTMFSFTDPMRFPAVFVSIFAINQSFIQQINMVYIKWVEFSWSRSIYQTNVASVNFICVLFTFFLGWTQFFVRCVRLGLRELKYVTSIFVMCALFAVIVQIRRFTNHMVHTYFYELRLNNNSHYLIFCVDCVNSVFSAKKKCAITNSKWCLLFSTLLQRISPHSSLFLSLFRCSVVANFVFFSYIRNYIG